MSATEIDFGGLSIRYDERVLEPRSWTTSQSRWAADLLRDTPPGPLLELCSGAGHIGLLAVAYAPRDLVMVDESPAACAYARENVDANPVAAVVDVREGPMADVLGAHERFAAVIAHSPDGMTVAWDCLEVIEEHLMEQGWALVQLEDRSQADVLVERLGLSAVHRLEVRQVREYDDRGVLVLVARPDRSEEEVR